MGETTDRATRADAADSAAPAAAPAVAMGGLEDAIIDLRVVGHCSICDRIVLRKPDGSCPQGHPADCVIGRVILRGDEEVPRLPGFNLAAFLIPPLWGPFHHQWIGVVFLPMWLFVDSIIGSAGTGGMVTRIAAGIVILATLAFQAFFAKRANGLAWRRVADNTPVAAYAARQRIWAIASVPVAALAIGWAVWFHLVFSVAPH
jgi:hypothetical protein